jgi:hypothetical protein
MKTETTEMTATSRKEIVVRKPESVRPTASICPCAACTSS